MTLPGQTSLPFDDDDDYEREPDPPCPACGHERPWFKGMKNRARIYNCANEGCQLVWESLRFERPEPRPIGRGGVTS
jgi:hypothetical protein